MDYRKLGLWQLVILAFLLNFIVQAMHEAGHWIIFEIMGRRPVWGYNQLLQIWGDTPPLHPGEWITTIAPDGEKGWLHLASTPGKTEYRIMLFAGPFASLLGVVFGLSLVRWNHKQSAKQIGLVMALIASLIMSQYFLRGFHRMGGDEYFLAANLGIPKYIIDIPFGFAFIIAFIFSLKTLGNWRTRVRWLGAIVIGSIPAGLFLVNANGIILTQVNQGNVLFRPLFGWSLPVIIVNSVICLLLWIWWKGQNRPITVPISLDHINT